MGFESKDREDIGRHLGIIETEIKHIKETLEQFVTRPEFDPVKKLVYGVVALMLSALVAAVISQVLKS